MCAYSRKVLEVRDLTLVRFDKEKPMSRTNAVVLAKKYVRKRNLERFKWTKGQLEYIAQRLPSIKMEEEEKKDNNKSTQLVMDPMR